MNRQWNTCKKPHRQSFFHSFPQLCVTQHGIDFHLAHAFAPRREVHNTWQFQKGSTTFRYCTHYSLPNRIGQSRFSGILTGMVPLLPGSQCAFKYLMTHKVLQFALHITIRYVLHQCGSQDIHCWKVILLCFHVSIHNYQWAAIVQDWH